MLKTPFHHRCTHYYTSLISRDIMGFLVTSMADMSLKKCTTLISQSSKIIHPGQNSNIFFRFAFGLAVISISHYYFDNLRKFQFKQFHQNSYMYPFHPQILQTRVGVWGERQPGLFSIVSLDLRPSFARIVIRSLQAIKYT